MRSIGLKLGVLFISLYFFNPLVSGQNSLLVNFGSNSCSSPVPSYSIIRNPLSINPLVNSSCDFSQQVPDFFNVFIAYNPKNNKIYIADIRSGIKTDIWVLDQGLPANISCPSFIPAAPTYSYDYVANNFEFDNNGNLWSFSNYDPITGQCNLDNFDVNTGVVLSTKILRFPAGDFPTTIDAGDLTILPNGRLFACLGSNDGRLYEITDYNNSAAFATATLLQVLPKNCYGIAYLNGQLELTGIDAAGCYYYNYDISTNTLGGEKSFQNGYLPIDNTSFTPAVGITKKLVSAVKVNGNTADLTYELYGENMGNTIINNIGVTDNLTSAFGSGNVSNVTASFVAGANAADLTLNPFYNGTGNTQLLNSGQHLNNRILNNQDYYFKIRINCRVTNLNTIITYFNSASINGDIGNAIAGTLTSVSDLSNNGESTAIDPNKNGNPSDVNENIPTPFMFGTLPVKFIDFTATQLGEHTARLQWKIAVPAENAARFEIEYSSDARIFITVGTIIIDNLNQSNYQFIHTNIQAGNLFYRIKETDTDGSITYSRIQLLRRNNNRQKLIVYPNPVSNIMHVIVSENGNKKITLMDVTGRKVFEKISGDEQVEINTAAFSNGTYLLQVNGDSTNSTFKIIVQHY